MTLIEQKIVYKQAEGNMFDIDIICSLQVEDTLYCSAFRIDKNYLYQDSTWAEIRERFKLLDRQYAIAKGFLS